MKKQKVYYFQVSSNLYKKVFFPFFLLLTVSFFSCTQESLVQIHFASQSENLLALNKNAKSNTISKNQNEKFLLYGFSAESKKQIANGKNQSLQLNFTLENPGNVEIFFLKKSDVSKGKLKKNIPQRAKISGAITPSLQNSKNFTVSFIPSAEFLYGFAIFSTADFTLNSVQIVNAKIGWSYADGNACFFFNENGGIIPQSKENAQNSSWSLSSRAINQNENHKIYFALNNIQREYGQNLDDAKVVANLAGQNVNFYPNKTRHNEVLNTLYFSNKIENVKFIKNAKNVDAVIIDSVCEKLNSTQPIKTDIGLIQNWNQKNWRNPQFEFYEWNEFPGILIFDFANYKIQDDFLKRLAFFVEKKDSVGTLMHDEEIKNLHGWNAHDYKSESLADFFECARVQNFPLNESELLLKKILLENGLISEIDEKIVAGRGALISISTESAAYLRASFLCHEGMHGVFFIDENFRNFISQLYGATDEKSIEFLKAYWSVTPSLNYNIDDDYLMKNEFMGYLVQQNLRNVEKYFAQNLANRRYINQFNPELADYMKETNAQGLVQAATILDEYLFTRWNFNLGRTWKISASHAE